MEIIRGATHIDSRGTLTYFNELNLEDIKRFYLIEHPEKNIVRAWQGHKVEQKWFYVLSGSFTFVIGRLDNWEEPSQLKYQEFILSSDIQMILHVPSGYVNGFKSNEVKSRLLVFSDLTVNESIKDDFKFNKELWYKW